MRIEEELKLDFSDVLIRPKRSTLSSRKEVDLIREFEFKNSKQKWIGIPIMASNMDGVGTLEMLKSLQELKLFTCLTKTYKSGDLNDQTLDDNYFAISTGINEKDYTNLKEITKNHKTKFICIDVANGYSEKFGDFVSIIRKDFPNHIIIAGNVVTADMTQELLLRGADIVKVGIGPGSVCTTRIQTGVGYPQLSAIIECSDAAHGLGGHIIADGGCTSPGDVAKAFAAGADFVMLGGMFAGHEEGNSEIITKYTHKNEYKNENGIFVPIFEEIKTVQFYGMSSEVAVDKHFDGLKNYRSSEGRVVEIPYRGKISSTVQSILGGLRSTCTYVGASTLKQLSKCTTFVKVKHQYNEIFTK